LNEHGFENSGGKGGSARSERRRLRKKEKGMIPAGRGVGYLFICAVTS